MEELETTEKQGFFARLFHRRNDDPFEEYESEEVQESSNEYLRVHHTTQYMIRIRRQVLAFDEAVAAADGLKRGEQQILNIASADPTLRERIKDFLAGVNYAHEGTWEEVGEHVYLLAPGSALVESVPATPRMTAAHN
ncbi:MAG: cell division protein SepF [Armatimonadetes bacterium]|nr:cell division protein SepF [Armatimonadota bacterium]